MSADARRGLQELARLRGIKLAYTAHDGHRVHAPTDTVRELLGALGHPVPDAAAVTAELERARHERDQRVLDPVLVRDRDGRLSPPIRLPRGVDPQQCRIAVHRSDGDSADLTDDLPAGYHTLEVEGPGFAASALLLVPPPRRPERRGLGVISPLYALRGQDDWGVGSFADLAAFGELAESWGADLAGTLPLFAGSARSPIDPSPYLPLSRMFWNELYVDVPDAAELAGADATSEPVTSARPDPYTVRSAREVDYELIARAKRRALQVCAESMASARGRRRDAFEAFVRAHPELPGYADFRSADERIGTGWRAWPGSPRLPEGSVDPTASHYHRFVQYAATTQLGRIAERGRNGGTGLYLDLPVGVHPDGFDTWRWQELFANAGVGAPPDAFFASGQAWGFPPLHPDRLRTDHYEYFIQSLRRVLTFARAIRIDHILGLQRLYWIPPGADAMSGAYVRYREDELLAIVAIEADRAGATVVGEDLGTVSPEIRRAMDRDGILHTFVYQFAATPEDPLPQPRQPSAASVGSHDLPRFAAFWRGSDIADRLVRRDIDAADATLESRRRRALIGALAQPSAKRALRRCLESLAAGPATYLFVDVADLEGDVQPDNRPGTGPEAGNWRRRLSRSIATLGADHEARCLMTDLATARSAADTKGPHKP